LSPRRTTRRRPDGGLFGVADNWTTFAIENKAPLLLRPLRLNARECFFSRIEL